MLIKIMTYIYIEKNSLYGKTEIINSVDIKNINVNRIKELGDAKFYKPIVDEYKRTKNIQSRWNCSI